jgi:hypothetical protein
MPLSQTQFTALFLGAFGQAPADLGVDLDDSGAEPVGAKNGHTITLFVFDGNAIEWRIDGNSLLPFVLNGRDQKSQARKLAALDQLNAALG